MVTEVTSRTL